MEYGPTHPEFDQKDTLAKDTSGDRIKLDILNHPIIVANDAPEKAKREQDEKLEHVRTHDSMTGLLNADGFMEAVEKSRAGGTQGALINIDINDFKNLNDTETHLAGDVAIKSVGIALKQLFRRMTDYVAHPHGDEFLAFIPDATAEEIQQRLEEFFGSSDFEVEFEYPQPKPGASREDDEIPDPNAKKLHVSLSIGLITTDPNETTKQEMIRADKAMYEVKKSRKQKTSR